MKMVRRAAFSLFVLAIVSSPIAANRQAAPAAKPPELLFRVDNVQVKAFAGGVAISADGTASTPGWTNVQLKLKSSPSTSGKLVYDLVGAPPKGIVLQVLTPVKAGITWNAPPKAQAKGVLVNAKTNSRSCAEGDKKCWH